MIEKLFKWLESMITGTARAPNKPVKHSVQVLKTETEDKGNGIKRSGLPVTIEVKQVHIRQQELEQASVESEAGLGDSTIASTTEKTPRQIVVFRRLLLLASVGVLLILLANIFELDDKLVSSNIAAQQHDVVAVLDSKLPSNDSPFMSIEQALEQRTKAILEKMIGVGHVTVLITVESTEEQIIKTNTNQSESITQETDKNGGVREVTTTTNDGQVVFMETNEEQEPVITKIINPRIRGVLIVAEGAEDATVRKLIIQAVEKGLNVHQSKVSVVPSKI